MQESMHISGLMCHIIQTNSNFNRDHRETPLYSAEGKFVQNDQELKMTWLQRKDYEKFWEQSGSILLELCGLGEAKQILQGSVVTCCLCYSGDESKGIMYSNGMEFSTTLDCMDGFGSHRLFGDLQSTLCAAFTTRIWSWAYVHVSKIDFK